MMTPTSGFVVLPPDGPPPEPAISRRTRLAVAGLGLLLVVALVLVLRPRAEEPQASPAPTAGTPAPTSSSRVTSAATSVTGAGSAPVVVPTSALPPQPVDECGEPQAWIDLGARPVEQPTGIRLLVGAGLELDLDTGRLIEPLVPLPTGRRVNGWLRAADATYLLTADCSGQSPQVSRIGADGVVSDIRVPLGAGERLVGLFSGDQGPLALVSVQHTGLALQPLTGGTLLPLGQDAVPIRSSVGPLVQTYEGDDTVLSRLDTGTGERTEVARFGRAGLLVEGDWLVSVGATGPRRVGTVQRLDGGDRRTFVLPDTFSPARINPTGRYLLGYDGPAEMTEEDTLALQVFDLETGLSQRVPGLHLLRPGDMPITAVFDGASDRVVIAARTADAYRYLVWTPGETTLQASPRQLPLGTDAALMIEVLPSGG